MQHKVALALEAEERAHQREARPVGPAATAAVRSSQKESAPSVMEDLGKFGFGRGEGGKQTPQERLPNQEAEVVEDRGAAIAQIEKDLGNLRRGVLPQAPPQDEQHAEVPEVSEPEEPPIHEVQETTTSCETSLQVYMPLSPLDRMWRP